MNVTLMVQPDLNWPVHVVRAVHRAAGTRRGMTRLLRLMGVLAGHRMVSVPLIDGRVVRLQIDDPAVFDLVLFGDHLSEGIERDLVQAALPERGVFFDVGANVGWYATLAARRVGSGGTVIAFEPNPKMFKMLEQSLARYSAHARCYTTAIGDSEDAAARLFVPRCADMGALAPMSDATAISCEIARLDTVVARDKLPPPDLVKIDVEGAELLVLKGARRVLGAATAPVVLFEYPFDTAERFGYEAAEAVESIRSSGMQVYQFADHPARLVPLRALPACRMNLVAVPECRRSMLRQWIAE